MAANRPHRARSGTKVERDDALRPYRTRRRPRRSPAEVARPTGRYARLPDVYSAGVSSRQHAAAAPAEEHGHARPEADRGVAAGARQLPAHQVVLADGDTEDRADFIALRCRRH